MSFFKFYFDFIGREKELHELKEMYDSNGFSFACIYGRRRVGKSSLIRQFINENAKVHISITAIEHNDVDNLQQFSSKVLDVFPKAKSYISSFPSWDKALEYIYEESQNKKVIVFIDEYPYIAQGDRSISSVFQNYIDEYLFKSNI